MNLLKRKTFVQKSRHGDRWKMNLENIFLGEINDPGSETQNISWSHFFVELKKLELIRTESRMVRVWARWAWKWGRLSKNTKFLWCRMDSLLSHGCDRISNGNTCCKASSASQHSTTSWNLSLKHGSLWGDISHPNHNNQYSGNTQCGAHTQQWFIIYLILLTSSF